MYNLSNWVPISVVMPNILAMIQDEIISEEDIIEYLYRALEDLTTYKTLEPKLCIVPVDGYKAPLPPCFKYLDFILYKSNFQNDKELTKAMYTYTVNGEDTESYQQGLLFIKKQVFEEKIACASCNTSWKPLNMSWSTLDRIKSSFDVCPSSININNTCEHRFSIDYSAKKVITTFEKGLLLIAYRTYPLTTTGEYLIPDDSVIKNALETYIYMMYWQKRDIAGDQGAWNRFKDYQRQWELTSANANIQSMMPGVDGYIRINQNNKLLKQRSPYEAFYNAASQQVKLS